MHFEATLALNHALGERLQIKTLKGFKWTILCINKNKKMGMRKEEGKTKEKEGEDKGVDGVGDAKEREKQT